ncbi:hypothetical protein V6N13_125101 [Hibiscus sabdariffa]|uniref:RNase H type-1 domain-containing protein n=1 Tax=Hibiscus sabdariffa TaxID=183260 RepID=A0ABR2U5G7_9ROSI
MDCRICKEYGICLAIEVELWGIYDCLSMAWELGIDRMRLESDCNKAVQVLKDRSFKQGRPSIVQHIWNLMDRRWEVQLVFIRREKNKIADALAKLAWSLPFGYHEFMELPCNISDLYRLELPV